MSARVFGTHEATLTIQRVIGDKGLFESKTKYAGPFHIRTNSRFGGLSQIGGNVLVGIKLYTD